ncbi:MAG: N-acetylneuraminate synthase family protein [Planctomycetes bacterium]|nr:N-acetylneuraminate synthase family protein [Planctomycetota bacterium]
MRSAVRELIEGRAPSGCVVVAELGVNHNGSLERALRLVECARQAGADALKLQLYNPSELCSRLLRGDELELLARLRLDDDEHARVCAAAAAAGLPVIATPFDEPSLLLLERLAIPVVKVGSGEVTHTPLLTAVASLGRPVILSTGGCELADVDRAVGVLRGSGCGHLSLLHCVSAYPPPDAEVNLHVIPTLIRRYPASTVGFSDHTLGLDAATAAVALGAKIIEKHLTLDCCAAGPDHAVSADPRALAALVGAVRRVESMLGDGRKTRYACEGTIGRSIVAARDLSAGHLLEAGDVAFKRPGTGVRPYALDTLVGRRLSRSLQRDAQITEADVAAPTVVAGSR